MGKIERAIGKLRKWTSKITRVFAGLRRDVLAEAACLFHVGNSCWLQVIVGVVSLSRVLIKLASAHWNPQSKLLFFVTFMHGAVPWVPLLNAVPPQISDIRSPVKAQLYPGKPLAAAGAGVACPGGFRHRFLGGECTKKNLKLVLCSWKLK